MDQTTPSFEPDWKYLPDPIRCINQTQVYVKAMMNVEISNIEDAFRFLRDHSPSPLLLRKTSPEGLTVILEASHNPRIVFGRSVPTDDSDADIREIIDVLAANGIQAKLISG